MATLAVDDPVLYFDCPLDYTAQCGFDVLAHASEPYVSRLNFETSLGMMYAQYIAAQAFNSGGLGIIHSISHAISAFYDTHHGLNNAIALPRVWAFNMPVAYKRFADIARMPGCSSRGGTRGTSLCAASIASNFQRCDSLKSS